MRFIFQKNSSQKLMIPICIVHSFVYLMLFSSNGLIAYPAKRDVDAYLRKVKQQLTVSRVSGIDFFKQLLFEDYMTFCKSHGLESVSGKTPTYQDLHTIFLHLHHLRVEAIGNEMGGVRVHDVGNKLRDLIEKLADFIEYIGFNYVYGTLLPREIMLNEAKIQLPLNADGSRQQESEAMAECVVAYNELRGLVGQSKVSSFGELDLEWVADVLDYLFEKKIHTCVKYLDNFKREEFVRIAALDRHAYEPTIEGIYSFDYLREYVITTFTNQKYICTLAGILKDHRVHYDAEDILIQAANHIEWAQIGTKSNTLKTKDEL